MNEIGMESVIASINALMQRFDDHMDDRVRVLRGYQKLIKCLFSRTSLEGAISTFQSVLSVKKV